MSSSDRECLDVHVSSSTLQGVHGQTDRRVLHLKSSSDLDRSQSASTLLEFSSTSILPGGLLIGSRTYLGAALCQIRAESDIHQQAVVTSTGGGGDPSSAYVGSWGMIGHFVVSHSQYLLHLQIFHCKLFIECL